MNKTLLKMALLTSIITPNVMASTDDSRQILALLQQMQTSLTQLHSKVDTLESRLGTLEQEKSSALTKTQQTLATEPTQQAAALSSSIADNTTLDPWEMIDPILEEINSTYPWFDTFLDRFLSENPQKVISLLNEIKKARTDKEKLRDIRSRMQEGCDLYIDDIEDGMEYLRKFLDVILSPHSELLQKLLSYDSNILFDKYLSSTSLCAENLGDLEIAIRSNVISIDYINLSGYDKAIPGAEEMLIRLVQDGLFNNVKVLSLKVPHLKKLRDCATIKILQGGFKNILEFGIYCDNLGQAKEVVEKIIGAKKTGKLDKLSKLWFEGPGLDASKSDPESQELFEELRKLGVSTTFIASRL